MSKYFYAAIIALFTSACGSSFHVTTADPTDPVQEDVEAIVANENDLRIKLGQARLSRGLSCYVQEILSGTRISSSSPVSLGPVIVLTGTRFSFSYKESFNQLNSTSGVSSIVPPLLQTLFASKNYFISCTGMLVVRESNYYQFELNSDDGSMLYMGNSTVGYTLVVNNDGAHTMTLVRGSKFLTRGIHPIRVDYMQVSGLNHGLVLTSNGSVVDSSFMYY